MLVGVINPQEKAGAGTWHPAEPTAKHPPGQGMRGRGDWQDFHKRQIGLPDTLPSLQGVRTGPILHPQGWELLHPLFILLCRFPWLIPRGPAYPP